MAKIINFDKAKRAIEKKQKEHQLEFLKELNLDQIKEARKEFEEVNERRIEVGYIRDDGVRLYSTDEITWMDHEWFEEAEIREDGEVLWVKCDPPVDNDYNEDTDELPI